MESIYFSLPGNEALTHKLAAENNSPVGRSEIRRFPDGECNARLLSDVKDKKVVLVCTMHEPDTKLLPLYFFSKTAKSLGAKKVCLISPYLAYMRQDMVFTPGEGVTSLYFASLISCFADELITIDPHLHRIASLKEIYSIPTKVSHAADHISAWIKKNVHKPLIIGPDSESEQWVSAVAQKAGAEFIVLQKIRRGDSDVEISIPDVTKTEGRTPVLVDDIISTGRTMMATILHLKKSGTNPPICIGIHAVFAGEAYRDLKNAGAAEIITCNTIPHPSNRIDISDLLILP